jgi:hypothetical protein
VNLDKKQVEIAGGRVNLTGKEYQMLELLALRMGSTLTKEMFLNQLYGGMDEPEVKIIDVFICKLRKKLANASQVRTTSRLSGAAATSCASPPRVRGTSPHGRQDEGSPMLTAWNYLKEITMREAVHNGVRSADA